MPVKQAQIVIDVDDKSLVELNTEIKALEDNISNLKIGTKQWNEENQKLGKLKQKFSDATVEANKLQKVVEKVSGAEQAASIAKLGAGIVGAFSGVQGAIGLLGGSSKAFDELAAKGVMFLQVMGGLQAAADVFSKSNMAGLKSVAGGFGNLVKSVKTASAGMKTALISTGIGALIVGVGLLIAYWDELGDMVSGTAAKEKKALNDNLNLMTAISTEYAAVIAVNEKSLELLKEQNKAEADNLELATKRYENVKYISKVIQQSLEEQSALQAKLTNELEKADDETRLKLETDLKVSQEKSEQLKIELKLNELKKNEAYLYYGIADAVEKIGNDIKDNTDKLIILNSLNDKQQAIYLNQLDTLDKQKESINKIKNAGIVLTKQQLDTLATLDAQSTALTNQNEERKRILAIELEELNNQRKVAAIDTERIQRFMILSNALEEETRALELNTKIYEDQIEFSKERNDLILDYMDRRKQLTNFDSEGLRMFNEQNAALEKIVVNYELIFDENEKILRKSLEGKRVVDEVVKNEAEKLTLTKLIKEAEIDKLKNDKLLLLSKKEQNELAVSERTELATLLQIELNRLKNLKNAATLKEKEAVGDEAKKTAGAELLVIEGQYNDKLTQIIENKGIISNLNSDIKSSEQEITTNSKQQVKSTEAIAKATKDAADNTEKQSTLTAELKAGVEKYKAEIQASADLLSTSIGFIAGLQDRKAQEAQERINKYQEELSALEEQEDERQSKLLEYQEELKDANGQRYDDLQQAIADEQQASNSSAQEKLRLEAQIAKEEKKRQDAAHKAAQWRKAQAIIDATIQGVLAVIEALPNVVLAAIVGATAAVGVGTIVAQKIPPASQFKEGGYTPNSTSDSEAVGVVHANEYVVPANIVRSSTGQQHIAALESQRARGYQTGGYVQPATTVNDNQSGIDYDRLINGIAMAMSRQPAPQVSLVKISTGLQEVALTKQNAGLTRNN